MSKAVKGTTAYTVSLARAMFWLTVARVRPKAFDDLADKPLRAMRWVRELDKRDKGLLPASVLWREWDTRWNLSTEWIAQEFRPWQLVYWSEDPIACRQRLVAAPFDLVHAARNDALGWREFSGRITQAPDGTAVRAPATGLSANQGPVEILASWLRMAVLNEDGMRTKHPKLPSVTFLPEAMQFRVTADSALVFCSAWYVNFDETKTDARTRMRDAWRRAAGRTIPKWLDAAMTCYFDRMEESFKRIPTRRFKPEHFEWLVRSVVPSAPAGPPETYEHIAPVSADGAKATDASGVGKTVRKLAAFVGIPLP